MNPRKLDVHGMTSAEALQEVRVTCQRLEKTGYRGRLMIVHGYGSGGTGGVLRQKLRKWLKEEGFDYLCGELSGGNPGTTTVRFV